MRHSFEITVGFIQYFSKHVIFSRTLSNCDCVRIVKDTYRFQISFVDCGIARKKNSILLPYAVCLLVPECMCLFGRH